MKIPRGSGPNQNRLLELLKELGLILVSGTLFAFISCWSCWSDSTAMWRHIFICNGFWLLLAFGNAHINAFLDRKFDWIRHPVKRLSIGLTAVLVYTYLSAYLFTLFVRWLFGFGGSSGLNTSLVIAVVVTLLVTVFLYARGFLISWRELAVNAERLEKEKVAAGWAALKNQVNPHFLFNSLNVLSNLVYEDRDKAVEFIRRLSELYRRVLSDGEQDMVSLEDEIRLVEDYVFLQKTRFEDGLVVEIEVEDRVGYVLPLVLQLLLENAIKHNRVSTAEPLHVRIYREGNRLLVTNILRPKLSTHVSSTGIGLDNIRKRLSVFTSEQLTVHNDEREGGLFTVSIPILMNPAHADIDR